MSRLWLLLCCGLWWTPVQAADNELRAWLDRTEVQTGETVTLIIETGQTTVPQPDLRPLERDFIIRDRRTRSEFQMSGGRQQLQTRWFIQLEPKRTGALAVPPLAFGGARTPLLVLTVRPQSADSESRPPLFLEVEVEPRDPYVQAQVRYTVRLFYSVPLLEGGLDNPAPVATGVERLGEDIAYEAKRNERRYNVIERRYALFPERSGELRIPPIRFRGRIPEMEGTRPPVRLLLDPGQSVQAESEEVKLMVRPRPADYRGDHWLPSAGLTLAATGPEPPLRVGEPATWTLRVEAKGLLPSQLPALPLPAPAGARIYPEPPATETRTEGGWMLGRWEQRIAMVPAEPGELKLPELRLAWWDTVQDREQVAVIPARTLTVLPAPATMQPSSAAGGESVTPAPAVAPFTPTDGAGFWPLVSAALLGLWLLTLLGWWRSHRPRMPPVAAMEPPLVAAGHRRRELQRACEGGDPRAAAAALLAWAAVEWPQRPPASLGALAQRMADAAAIRELDRILYAPAPGRWDGRRLWARVCEGLTAPVSSRRPPPDELPPLYPQQD